LLGGGNYDIADFISNRLHINAEDLVGDMIDGGAQVATNQLTPRKLA
jgi:hypothetical protein